MSFERCARRVLKWSASRAVTIAWFIPKERIELRRSLFTATPDIPKGMLRDIIGQAGLSVDEFINLL